MTDEPRPAPQYGEYATPEEVARLRGVQSSPDPVFHQADPVKQAVTRPRRAWDLPLTVGLLVLGFILTLQSLSGFFAFSATLTAAFKVSGVDIVFGADADVAGILLLIIHCVLFLAAVGVSVLQLRAGRPAFWVPLVAGALAMLADIAVPLVLIATNPAYASVLLDRP